MKFMFKTSNVAQNNIEAIRASLFKYAYNGKLTALKQALMSNRQEFLAAIKLKNPQGFNIVHIAAQQGHDDIIQWMFKERLLRNVLEHMLYEQNTFGLTPVHYAFETNLKIKDRMYFVSEFYNSPINEKFFDKSGKKPIDYSNNNKIPVSWKIRESQLF